MNSHSLLCAPEAACRDGDQEKRPAPPLRHYLRFPFAFLFVRLPQVWDTRIMGKGPAQTLATHTNIPVHPFSPSPCPHACYYESKCHVARVLIRHESAILSVPASCFPCVRGRAEAFAASFERGESDGAQRYLTTFSGSDSGPTV